MLIAKDLSGSQEPLLTNGVQVTQQLNTVEQLDFTTWNTPENEAAYQMIKPRTLFQLPETGEWYRISENDGNVNGKANSSFYLRTVTALQVLQDLDEHLVRGKLKGSQSIQSVMGFITKGTQFTYTIHDTFSNYNFGDDGIGDALALSLFTDSVVANFACEFTTNGYHIDIYKQIGKHNAFVFLSDDDIYSLAETGDYTQIRTHVVGYGKTDDNGNPTVTAEYTSPNASVYGTIDDDLFTNDDATTKQQLIDGMKAQIKDYPLIQQTANVNKFKKANAAEKLNDPTMGNWGFIRSRDGIDIETRIIERTYYPQSNDVDEDTLTMGNYILDANDVIINLRNNRTNDSKVINKLKSSQTNVIEKIENLSSDVDGMSQDIDATKVGEVSD